MAGKHTVKKPIDFGCSFARSASRTSDRRPWEVGGTYYHVTHRSASGAVCHHVLELSSLAATNAFSRRLLEIAVHLADHPINDPDAYWSVYDRVVATPRSKRLLATLTVIRLSKYQLAERRRIIERNREKDMSRSRDIEILSKRVADLQAGRDIQNLDFAASHYFGLVGGDRELPSFERVISTTNEIIATAVKEGWEQLVLANPSNSNAAQLGSLEGTGKSFYFEMPTVAGLDLLINESRPPDLGTMPIVVAVVVLKSASFVENEKRRGLLEDWAVDRLNLRPDAAKREYLDGLWTLSQAGRDPSAVIIAVDAILTSRPAMPAPGIESGVRICAQIHRSRTRPAVGKRWLWSGGHAGSTALNLRFDPVYARPD